MFKLPKVNEIFILYLCMLIKELNESDVGILLPLFEGYRKFYRNESDPEGARLFLFTRMIKREAVVFGAFAENKLLGFTLLYPLFSSVRMKPIYLLNDLFVSPEVRNQAIGKKLLLHAQEYARVKKYAGLMLETEKSNDIGNHLYPTMGFHLETGSNFYFWENINF
jgi:ribosomal protein S18 acetylase RimI-like enzyme